MFFPVGDTPNPPGFRAWTTWTLIALNVAVYLFLSLPLSVAAPDPADPLLGEWLRVMLPRLPAGTDPRALAAQVSATDLLNYAHGYKPAAPSAADLLSSMFLHGGALHLAGNMLFLWIYGDNVEHRLGRLPFLLAYLLTGAAATLAFALLEPASMVPLVGASGAISGVLGMYFLWFPHNRVKVFLAFFPFLVQVVLVPARVVLGIYLVIDNLLPMLAGGGGGVAHGAHLGGFLAGLGLAWLVMRSGFRVGRQVLAEVAQVRARPVPGGSDPAARRVRQAEAELAAGELWLQQGQTVAAYQHLARAARLDPEGPAGARAQALLAALPGLYRRPG